jgi:hypothetical protein
MVKHLCDPDYRVLLQFAIDLYLRAYKPGSKAMKLGKLLYHNLTQENVVYSISDLLKA